MNENFLIPNQSSLYNIKAIYNAFVDNIGNSGFENIIINPEVNQLTQDSGVETKQAGWDFLGTNPIGIHYLGDGDHVRQDICPKLRSDEIYTIVLDIKITDQVRFSIDGRIVGANQYSPSIIDINYNNPIDYTQNLVRVLEPHLDEFGEPIRFQVSFNFAANNIPLISTANYNAAWLTFIKDTSALYDPKIEFYNISIVKGVLGINLDKRQSFFTDYVRYNNNNTGFYEASMDDGETYHRILTTRDQDVDEFVDILVTKDIIYTKNDCDLMFLRKDIPDAAERLITFLEGLRAEEDVNLAEAAKLVLDGGNIVVNNSQETGTGTPSSFFSLMVKRGDERDVGIRYNETIDRWQFTHDGIDWKIFGTGGSNATGTGTGSSELEYYAEILNRTPYKWGYYDLFDEVDQGDSVIAQNLNYNGDDTLYKVDDFPAGPWYITTKNIWNTEHIGNTYGFFVHALTNQHDNAGLNISYSLIGSGTGDPLLPTDPAWIPITMNEIVSPPTPIDEMYLKFEFIDDTIEFHSFGVFYGVWDYTSSTYTRLREYYSALNTNQTILVPNGAEYTVGMKALELYLNRVRQIIGVDYTEVDETHVQMLVPVNVGDVIEFYEKFGYADFSEDNSITLNAHMADSAIHCDCSDLDTRLTSVETWQTGFTELDASALAALSTHISDTSDVHDASAISVVSTSIDHSTATEIQTLLQDLDAAITTIENGSAPTTHVHTIAEVTGLQTELDGKALSSHVHTIAEVTGLQTELDDSNLGLGKDQVWEDLTSTRAINTVYTNTTDTPVYIKIDPVITEADTLVLEVSNDNVTFITMPDFNTIVPATHYYKLTDTSVTTPATIDLWVELS